MKCYLLLLGLTISILCVNFSEAKHKRKKYRGEIIKPIKEELKVEEESLDPVEEEIFIDPCANKHCSPGQVCKLTENGQPFCTCIEECSFETDPRRKVCSNLNTTWNSDCALYQMRCWCKYRDQKCQELPEDTQEQYRHMHINYYGECKFLEECTEGQMADFPRRMRDWLFNVMQDMADRDELSPYYLKMEREAQTNLTKRWTNAVIWKWCDLDSSHNRAVSRHELFPIRAPLVALEHCIAPFLDGCDSNNDHEITLNEWVKCMEIEEEEIEAHCEDIRDE
ncbi:secreted protein, acidic, cysteine-rich [Rhodnius prolixus]|uniref:Follistatin-like domain-containing protein n=1 Tax=Rhodnius prolixus TaxID=13249 RepID=A0A905QWV0_RHOPR